MKHSAIALICVGTLASIVSACAPFKPNDQHAGLCNEINSKLIFNGGTSNQRESNIQNAELPFLQRSYEKDNCDK